MKSFWFAFLTALTAACAAKPTAAPATAAMSTCPEQATSAPPVAAKPRSEPAAPEPVQLSAPIDEKSVTAATGAEKVESSPDGVVKASFPRKDVEVAVDAWKMPPFMGLTSWIAFTPGRKGASEAMLMGDLVLFEDEVNAALSLLLEHGVQVTALHNHFFFDVPRVYFMHVGGEGTVATLGGAIKAALGEVAAIRKKAPKPRAGFGALALPAKSSIDAAKLEAVFGIKGQANDGMVKVTFGRKATASCGCVIGKTMGVNTWAAFAGDEQNAAVDGDFAVTEDELQPVLKALRAGGINVVAIHHHMSGETPRVLFLHYWGRGKPTELAATVKKALDLTAWDKPKTETI